MTWKPAEDPRSVEINTAGRGGSIYFRQGSNTASFSWEFASSPAIALIFGTTQEYWEKQYPWAIGRQEEIYDFVASEVVRQKSAGSEFEVELVSGTITILEPVYSQREYPATKVESYGLRSAPVAPAPPKDVLQEQLHDHLSIAIRLQAAETLHGQGQMPEAELGEFLAKQIRSLYQPANGMERALALARVHDSEVVRQALLWASYNSTECAPSCAALLLDLAKAVQPGAQDEIAEMLKKLGLHNSFFDRQSAFKKLCQLVKMELDTSQFN